MNFSTTAQVIASVVGARTALTLGSDAAALAAALESCGVLVANADAEPAPEKRFDMSAWIERGTLSEEQMALAVQRLVRVSDVVLVCPATPPMPWVAAFAQYGFLPDLRQELRALDSQAVVFRRSHLETYNRKLEAIYLALERQNTAIEQLGAKMTGLSASVKNASQAAEDIVHSRIWRTLCSVGGFLLAAPALFSGRKPAQITDGAKADPQPAYARWIADFESRDQNAIGARLAKFTRRPLISVIVAAGSAAPEFLKKAVDSVKAQSYGEWELWIAGDAVGDVAGNDARIRVMRLPGDDAAALQSTFQQAAGEYVAVLNPQDEMSPDALFHVAELLNRDPRADVIYSDHDLIDPSGTRHSPFFKPDWSPDLLLSQNYINGLVVFRRSLGNELGGFRSALDGAEDYDLLLRLTRRTSGFRHIARILYHSRSGVAPARPPAEIEKAESLALQEHLREAHPGAWLENGIGARRWRIRYPIPSDTRVSIIIPSGGNVGMLETNLSTLHARTDYLRYEVVVIDNSRDDVVEQFCRTRAAILPGIRYIDWRRRPFNFSAICNFAANQCDAPLLVFLNDDTSVITGDWLRAMVELGCRPEVGAVGAKLVFPDGSIQHAGVAMGLFGRSGHVFKGLAGGERHCNDLPDVIRNVSAVTGACLLVRSSVFRAVGGFDEERFPVDGNDIDLCLKIGEKGLRVLYTPHALLCHHEAASKGCADFDAHPAEVQALHKKWKEVIVRDPFYNCNLTRASEDYSPRTRQETLPSDSVAP